VIEGYHLTGCYGLHLVDLGTDGIFAGSHNPGTGGIQRGNGRTW
jgi:hypothetical protein